MKRRTIYSVLIMAVAAGVFAAEVEKYLPYQVFSWLAGAALVVLVAAFLSVLLGMMLDGK